jgi:cbb3-type cytochrome c oxidase subunit III
MRRKNSLIAAAAAALAVLVAAGCGTGGLGNRKADVAKGKELFTAKCAACHVLADAGAVGVAGPSLDDAFAELRKQGFAESTIFEVVNKQIKYPTERDLFDPSRDIHVNGPLPTVQMPGDLVTGADREAVAAYVTAVAGLPVKASSAPAAGAPAGGGSTDGKAIFASAGCVACHTLKAAGATGAVGPNLDQVKPAKARVIDRVTNGKGIMPSFKGKLSDAQIQAVADFVSSNAGK